MYIHNSTCLIDAQCPTLFCCLHRHTHKHVHFMNCTKGWDRHPLLQQVHFSLHHWREQSVERSQWIVSCCHRCNVTIYDSILDLRGNGMCHQNLLMLVLQAYHEIIHITKTQFNCFYFLFRGWMWPFDWINLCWMECCAVRNKNSGCDPTWSWASCPGEVLCPSIERVGRCSVLSRTSDGGGDKVHWAWAVCVCVCVHEC